MSCVESEDHWSGDRLGSSAPVSWIKDRSWLRVTFCMVFSERPFGSLNMFFPLQIQKGHGQQSGQTSIRTSSDLRQYGHVRCAGS